MTRRRLAAGALLPAVVVIATLLAACGSGTGRPAAPTSTRTPAPARALSVSGGFVALANSGVAPAIMLYNDRTGRVVRQLLPGTRDGMAVSGLSIDRSGNLWITYSRGPKLQAPNLSGGEPKPDTCANEIAIWHAGTGRVSVFLRTGANVQISEPAVSPDGRLLAYLEAGCATGYFNAFLRVVDIASGRSWTIGQQIPRCHTITGPAWTADSRDLVVGYAPPASAHWRGPLGTCLAPLREELAEVSAAAAQPMLRGRIALAQSHCEVTSAAALAAGRVLAIEGRGPDRHPGAGQRLSVLQPAGHEAADNPPVAVPRRRAARDHRRARRRLAVLADDLVSARPFPAGATGEGRAPDQADRDE